ncbi:MAG: thioredoxin fold domain-containing protein, partial [Pseudomonadota bacterium]
RFPAQDPVAEVTVITDIDCPYCRRLHQQIEGYNDRGISVNYLMLPRAGRGSGSWEKAVAAACATDPEGALTDAMNGVDLAPASCEHRIGNEFTLARSLRSTGTPAFVLADGRLFDGFVGPADLAERLE